MTALLEPPALAMGGVEGRAPIALPLALTEPTLQAVIAGTCRAIRRPSGGQLERIRPGDRLWIREPFHLAQKFNGLSPSAVHKFGGRPTFATDIDLRQAEAHGLGRRRFAREMPRVWHRHHLIVREIRREALQAVSVDEALAEGFSGRGAWAAAWDRNLGYFAVAPSGTPLATWAANPDVLTIEFDRIAEPLP